MSGTPDVRGLEDDYFRRQEQELIEKMRERARLEAEQGAMAEAIGVANRAVLEQLQALGFDRDTVKLLHLVPLIEVAWVDGQLTRSEAAQIWKAARVHGIEEASPAGRRLSSWLETRPSGDFFRRCLRIIRDILLMLPSGERQSRARDLHSCCVEIAAASGGLLGLGSKISAEERALLERIAADFAADHQAASRQLMLEVYNPAESGTGA